MVPFGHAFGHATHDYDDLFLKNSNGLFNTRLIPHVIIPYIWFGPPMAQVNGRDRKVLLINDFRQRLPQHPTQG
jgi:hypothetical protein